jgi:hypothetical protein
MSAIRGIAILIQGRAQARLCPEWRTSITIDFPKEPNVMQQPEPTLPFAPAIGFARNRDGPGRAALPSWRRSSAHASRRRARPSERASPRPCATSRSFGSRRQAPRCRACLEGPTGEAPARRGTTRHRHSRREKPAARAALAAVRVQARERFVQAFTAHGKPYFYFRKPGCARIKLPGLPGSAEFMDAYQAALAASAPRAGRHSSIAIARCSGSLQ